MIYLVLSFYFVLVSFIIYVFISIYTSSWLSWIYFKYFISSFISFIILFRYWLQSQQLQFSIKTYHNLHHIMFLPVRYESLPRVYINVPLCRFAYILFIHILKPIFNIVLFCFKSFKNNVLFFSTSKFLYDIFLLH